MNVLRYNDFSEAFEGRTARIPIFKEDAFNDCSEAELKTQTYILIAAIEDSDIQIIVKNALDEKLQRNETINYNEAFNDLIDKN